MTPKEYEEEKKFVLSELADEETKRRGLGADYINDLIKPFTDDKQVMLACLEHHSGSTEFASQRLWADKEFVSKVVIDNGNHLSFASNDLIDDVDVVKAACSENGYYAFQYASSRIKSDPELISKCSNIIGNQVLNCIDSSIKDSKEKILSLIENGYSNQHNISTYDKRTIANIVMDYVSPEIQLLVGNGDPVEILTKAIASEKLSNRLSEQLKPKIESREPMKMKI